MVTEQTLRESLVEKARSMIPVLQKRSEVAKRDLTLPAETIAEFQESGFFKVMQPKRYGGYEMDPHVFFDLQLALAEGCMSSAWVYGVVAVHAFQLALFDDRAQQEVWGDDPSTLMSSSYQPVGDVTRVDGGFRLSGHWSFSSGSEHCDWVLLGAFVPSLKEGDRPDMRTFLLPKSDYRIQRNWDVFGLQGTGSHDIIVEDVFVPEYRTHRAVDGFACDSPGNKVNTAPVYRIPWAQIFSRAVASSGIGAAQGALNNFLEIAAARRSSNTGQKTVDDPDAQQAVARVMRVVDELKLTLYRNLDHLVEKVNAGQEIAIEDRVRFRVDASLVMSKCIEVVDPLQTLCGARGIFFGTPIVQYFLDMHAGRAHVANEPTRYLNNLGGLSLGHQNRDFFI